jgi:hypothetical protein
MGVVKHGGAARGQMLPLYKRWAGIKQRCTDPNHAAYKNYGGRGITLHKPWFDFAVFAKAVGEPPSDKHHLDRIDNNKGYIPNNVRWVTQAENNRNSRRCNQVTIGEKTQPIFAWLAQYSLSRSTFDARIRRGWTIEQALTTPPLKGITNERSNQTR